MGNEITRDEGYAAFIKLQNGCESYSVGDILSMTALIAYQMQNGVSLPKEFFETDNVNRRTEILQTTFMSAMNTEDERNRAAVISFFDRQPAHEKKQLLQSVRSMMFNKANVGEDGLCHDASSKVLENADFTAKDGVTIPQWDTVIYIDLGTGKRIDEEQFTKLSPDKKRNFTLVRAVTVVNGALTYLVTPQSYDWINAAIENDIRTSPTTVLRYLRNIGSGYQKHPDDWPVYPYRDTVAKATAALGKPEYAEGGTLHNAILSGSLKSWWHVKIATLETLHQAFCSNSSFAWVSLPDTDLNQYLDLVELFCSDDKKLPDEEIQTYRNGKTGQLMPGVDKTGAAVIPEKASLTEQRQYLKNIAEDFLFEMNRMLNTRDDCRTNPVLRRAMQLFNTINLNK